MKQLSVLLCHDMKHRAKDGFLIGYNIIFPIIMILLMGYLLHGSYGKTFTSYHYYSIVMLPFCVSMAIITAAYAGKEEAYHKTASRLLFAPVTYSRIVLAKLLSCTVLISVCNLIVLLFAQLALHLPVGRKIVPVTFLLTTESFCICAIGIFIGLGMKHFILVKNFLNIPICAAAILGGAFYPIGTLNPTFDLWIKLSPLTWINRSIFFLIYDDNYSLLWQIAGSCLLIGGVFTVLAIKLFKKEEFIHGDLPGYNK